MLGTQATFEAWVTWNGPDWMSWQRIFDFGTSDAGEGFSSGGANAYYIFLTPRSGAGTLRCGYNDPGPPRVERWCETAVLAVGVEQHVAVVWNDDTTTADLYLNGARVARDQNKHFALADLVDNNNWLGRAQWPDALFVGSYNEFRIYGHALTPAEVLGSFTQGPDTLAVVSQGRYVYTGDANGDGAVDIADAIKILGYLFAGDTDVKCLANLDTNNDRAVDIADAISVLSYLFAGGSMTAPDGTPISAGAHGCALYEEQEGQLPCDVPCTP